MVRWCSGMVKTPLISWAMRHRHNDSSAGGGTSTRTVSARSLSVRGGLIRFGGPHAGTIGREVGQSFVNSAATLFDFYKVTRNSDELPGWPLY